MHLVRFQEGDALPLVLQLCESFNISSFKTLQGVGYGQLPYRNLSKVLASLGHNAERVICLVTPIRALMSTNASHAAQLYNLMNEIPLPRTAVYNYMMYEAFTTKSYVNDLSQDDA